ncbi:MAG: ABC transporter ATP-binding protein [Candidatus Hodarchaeota archaeon]
MDNPTIETKDLTKVYRQGNVLAVDSLTTQVFKGEIFGLLGENGAGKTTTVRLLTTMIKPTRGTARIADFDILEAPNRVRELVGVLPQDSGLYLELTVRENLAFFARLQGLQRDAADERVGNLLELIEMEDRSEDRAETLSGGLQRRVQLARTLVASPQVIFLDEPTAGLDVLVARKVRNLIRRLARKENVTVVLCTHNMFDAQRLCDRVLVMSEGREIELGTPKELLTKYKGIDDKITDLEDLVIHLIGGEVSEELYD